MYYNITLNTYENNNLLSGLTTTGKYEDNILTFHTDNDFLKINTKNFKFTKENNESIFILTTDSASLTLKELNNTLTIPLDYINYNYCNNNIELTYKLISQEEPLTLNITIGEEVYDV